MSTELSWPSRPSLLYSTSVSSRSAPAPNLSGVCGGVTPRNTGERRRRRGVSGRGARHLYLRRRPLSDRHFAPEGGVMARTETARQAPTPPATPTTLSSVDVGHDARDGFCPGFGTVAPGYRARRAAAPPPAPRP